MAHPTPELISGLRQAARNLRSGAPYMWGHMGSCNCGHLAQVLTRLTRADIHAYAMQGRGDWREQLEEYCPTSGLPLDLLAADMLQSGLTVSDLQHLERLTDPFVRAAISQPRRDALRHNDRHDVVLYLETWAGLLENQLLESLPLPVWAGQAEQVLA